MPTEARPHDRSASTVCHLDRRAPTPPFFAGPWALPSLPGCALDIAPARASPPAPPPAVTARAVGRDAAAVGLELARLARRAIGVAVAAVVGHAARAAIPRRQGLVGAVGAGDGLALDRVAARPAGVGDDVALRVVAGLA